MMHSYTLAAFLLAVLVGIPSSLLYLAEVVFVVKHFHMFRSFFFCLFVVRAIPAIYNVANNYVGMRFCLLGWFLPAFQRAPPSLVLLLWFTNYYTFHVENLSTLFLVLSRLTSIIWPLSRVQNKVWRVLFPFACLAIFLGPLPFTLGIFELEPHLEYADDSNSSFVFFNKNGQMRPFSQSAYISGLAIMLCCALVNVVSFFLYRHFHSNKFCNKKVSPVVDGLVQVSVSAAVCARHSRIERRLNIYAFGTFLSQFSMATTHVLCAGDTVSLNNLHPYVVPLYGLLTDLCTVAVPAWLMLWASSSLQEIFAKEWRCLSGGCSKLAGFLRFGTNNLDLRQNQNA